MPLGYWRVPVLGGPKNDKSSVPVAFSTDPTVDVGLKKPFNQNFNHVYLASL